MGFDISFENCSDKNREALLEGKTITKSDKSYLWFVSIVFDILDKKLGFNWFVL